MLSKKFLGQEVKVKIDRPLGSKHPKYNYIYPINYGFIRSGFNLGQKEYKYIYPINYGFIPDTLSGDGEELDAYILEVKEPLQEFVGKCIAIIHRLDDNDDKLIVIPKELKDISNQEIIEATNFQERYFKSIILR